MFIAFPIFWLVLSIIGNWFLFQKAGKPGWHSIIPILNSYDEFEMCWDGSLGIIYAVAQIVLNYCNNAEKSSMMITLISAVAGLIILVLLFVESMRLAKVFGKGVGTGILLFIFDRIGRIVLGLSSAPYLGREAAEEPFS